MKHAGILNYVMWDRFTKVRNRSVSSSSGAVVLVDSSVLASSISSYIVQSVLEEKRISYCFRNNVFGHAPYGDMCASLQRSRINKKKSIFYQKIHLYVVS